MINGNLPGKTNYVVDTPNRKRYEIFQVLAGILEKLSILFGVSEPRKFEKDNVKSENHYLPILKKYWGENAEFRMLKFYTEPEFSNLVTEISQGQIVSSIITQSETCLSGLQAFQNIFITAPTGAGKSLLFQIPAIYLAEQHNAVTIVVTPLIALMKDQVTQMERERGVSGAKFQYLFRRLKSVRHFLNCNLPQLGCSVMPFVLIVIPMHAVITIAQTTTTKIATKKPAASSNAPIAAGAIILAN